MLMDERDLVCIDPAARRVRRGGAATLRGYVRPRTAVPDCRWIGVYQRPGHVPPAGTRGAHAQPRATFTNTALQSWVSCRTRVTSSFPATWGTAARWNGRSKASRMSSYLPVSRGSDHEVGSRRSCQ